MQSLGWPGCVNLLKSWYGHNEIATWWSVLTACNIGGIMAPVVVASIASYWGWEYVIYCIGTVASIIYGSVVMVTDQ